jgi:glycosyltransferase involved in cell wall biosynthesis
MHIGVDATCWQNTRGYGRHARALLTALANGNDGNRYTFFMDSIKDVGELPPTVEIRTVSVDTATVIAASAEGSRSWRDMWRMARAMSVANLDVLLFPTIYSYLPVLTRAKKIVVIHDVIAEKYPALTMPHRRARLFWKAKVALGRWQADAVATVSDYSRRGLVEYFGMDARKIHVVSEASNPVFRMLASPELPERLASFGLTKTQRIIVYVGGFSPHKNLEMLIAAFDKLANQPAFGDIRLVLVGEYEKEVFHSYAGTVRKQIEDLGLEDKVVFTGYLPDEELVILLNVATVSVLPSLIEGFGLPAIEAAACGCPVVATKESPLPGLLGEGGLYFDPTRQEELDSSLEKIFASDSLRSEMSKKGVEAAGRLTWKAAAEQMSDLLKKVAAT